MQSVSSRIWTRVAVSISYNDNHCTILEEQLWCYLPPAGKIKRFIAFPKGISLKVNSTAPLEFELTYFKFVVQHINDYATGILPYIYNNKNMHIHIKTAKTQMLV